MVAPDCFICGTPGEGTRPTGTSPTLKPQTRETAEVRSYALRGVKGHRPHRSPSQWRPRTRVGVPHVRLERKAPELLHSSPETTGQKRALNIVELFSVHR